MAPKSKKEAPKAAPAPAAPAPALSRGGSKEAAPKVTMGAGLQGAVKLVVKTFLEQKHYQQLHDLLSEEWEHCHSLTAAVKLMEAHGVHLSPAEEKKLQELPEDRMIDSLVMKMPQQSREQFEHFFLQLSLIASTTTRLRSALESGDDTAVEEVLDSAENVGILQYLLKMAVAQAGREVKLHTQDHEAWLASAAGRMGPMLQAQTTAITCKKAMIDAKAELEHHHCTANEKTKKFLMNMVGASGAALVATCFSGWFDVINTMKKEKEIRKEYAEEIDAAQKRLQDYIEKQLGIMKSMINKKHEAAKGGIAGSCLRAFIAEWNSKADRLAKEEEMKALEGKLAGFTAEQSAKNKKVLGRMTAGSEQGLLTICMQAWIQFIADYNKDKAYNDAVKAEEAKIAEFMKTHNDQAKKVLNRMSAGTDSGLIGMCFKGWVEFYTEVKKANELEDILASGGGRFKSFNDRNKASAGSAMDRAAVAADESTMLVIFWWWKRYVRTRIMMAFCESKNDKKKNQIKGVKTLFKNFANELEVGLKEGTPRLEAGSPPKGRKSSGRPSPKEDGYGPA